METRSKSISELLELIRSAFQKDWREQKKRGLRDYSPSMQKVNVKLSELYPDDFSSSFLKKVYIYNNHSTVVHPLKLKQLELFLEYLYLHESTVYGWPKVAEAVRNFEDGRFAPLVDRYNEPESLNKLSDVNTAYLVRAGATPDVDLHTQLLQIAIAAKQESEDRRAKMSIMETENNALSNENNYLRELIADKASIIKDIEASIKELQELMLIKDTDTSKIQKVIDEQLDILNKIKNS